MNSLAGCRLGLCRKSRRSRSIKCGLGLGLGLGLRLVLVLQYIWKFTVYVGYIHNQQPDRSDLLA